MTPAHRVLFDKVDSIQATIDFIRITGGPFTGKTYRSDGRSCTSFTKFLINFRSVIFRAIAGLSAAMNAVSLTEAIFYELRPGDVNTEYVTEFNQLVVNVLMNACDEEALNIVLRYERSDNGQQQMKKDGRRALLALMQTYSPVSTNAGNNAKAKLVSAVRVVVYGSAAVRVWQCGSVRQCVIVYSSACCSTYHGSARGSVWQCALRIYTQSCSQYFYWYDLIQEATGPSLILTAY
jgi:hypothetical protein